MNLKQLLMLLGLVRPEKILYIGGSDVLPPPLSPEEERTLIARLAEGDEPGTADAHRAQSAACGLHRAAL